MDMKYVDMIMNVIKINGYTVTKNPCKAKLKKEYEEQIFVGNCIEFEHKTPFGNKTISVFIHDTEDNRHFHNGSSVFKCKTLPSVIWFKEVHDKITILEGFYI